MKKLRGPKLQAILQEAELEFELYKMEQNPRECADMTDQQVLEVTSEITQ